MRAPSHSTMRMRQRRAVRRYLLLPMVAALVALVGGSLLMLANAPRALACPVCISPDKVTLIGDGISGVMTITDPARLTLFGAATFMGFDQSAPVAEPAPTGNGYELTRYFKNSGVPASFWTLGFDHMRYYPGASGQPGYVYYEGFVSDEASRYAQNLGMPQTGRWYQLSASQDEAIQEVLAPAPGVPATMSNASSPPTLTQPPAILRALSSLSLPVIILLACLVALAAVVGYRLARYRRHPAPFIPAEEGGES